MADAVRFGNFFDKLDFKIDENCLPWGVRGTCMMWNGYKTKIGYGHARIMSFMMPEEGYKQILIHRAAYMLKIKQTSRPPIPEGLEVSHLCNDKACANPEHLTLETHRSNHIRSQCFRCA